VVEPNGPLEGTVTAGGAKNSALKLMVACLLAEGRTVLSNVPRIDDVDTMADVLRAIGARAERLDNGDVAVTTPPAGELVPAGPYELFERMRASVVVLGLLLARCGSVRMPLPGGDDFGDRPIDFHINGLSAMGARFESSRGEVRGTVPGGRLVGTRVVLEYPSHTATDNLLMAAVLAKGTTVIENAAKEPEVADLAAMLCDMGAVVRGAGTSRIEIEGVDELRPTHHTVVPDRVVAATFLAAVGIAGGEVTIADARPDHMEMLLRKVDQMGVTTDMGPHGLRASAHARLVAADEESTVTRLKAHRNSLIDPKIAEHGGRIVKTTGDGMLVEFASVVDALRCVVEIQRGMQERNADVPEEMRIDFRFGVNVGDVIIDGDDIYGDGVNVAARLEDLAEPGGVLVAGVVHDQVRDKLSFSFDDLGDRDVKNIPRPVRAYRVKLSDDGRPPPLARPSTGLGVGRPHIAWIGAVGLLLIVVASGGAWYVAGAPKSPATVALQSTASLNLTEPAKRPSHLSIVVLPFANLSGDANQDYFADGITENLTTDLSRLRGSFVIARNTAFTFKGKNVDAREIGKELGVRYVLEGSVQRDQSQVRVNAQLIDAENGGHLWAGRFDGRQADLFQMQDQIVASLGEQLRVELIADQAHRAQQASNPDSMDLYFQGQAWFNKGLNRENLIQARSFYERAVALDPDNLSASTAKLNVDLMFAANYEVDDRAERLAAVEATVIKLLAQAPNNAAVHYLMCAVQIRINRGAEAIAECERALALNPNLANAHAQIGFACLVNGHPEETESHVHEAIEASPRDTNMYIWIGFIAAAKLYSGADEEAVTWLRRTLEFNRNYGIAHFYLSAALELLGRRDDAQAEVQAGLALDPQFTVRRFRAGAPSDNPIFLKQRERIIQAMQKAGIPEG